jgi:hypothetical protein
MSSTAPINPRHFFPVRRFYDTTLDTLLSALRVRRVIVTGIARQYLPSPHHERCLHA